MTDVILVVTAGNNVAKIDTVLISKIKLNLSLLFHTILTFVIPNVVQNRTILNNYNNLTKTYTKKKLLERNGGIDYFYWELHRAMLPCS